MTSELTTADRSRMLVVCELYELIAALDRRVPQVERVGEIAIARAAAALRGEALKRIATLEHEADADADADGIASWFDPTQATACTERRTTGETNGTE
jgi:hypothetical protein